MDPLTHAKSASVYGAMAYPLLDDWELVENELLKSPIGSYVIYRSTEAKEQQLQDPNFKDTINCFEVFRCSASLCSTKRVILTIAGSVHLLQSSGADSVTQISLFLHDSFGLGGCSFSETIQVL